MLYPSFTLSTNKNSIYYTRLTYSHINLENRGKLLHYFDTKYLYNIVIIDNFDFNIFQIDLNFRSFGIFLCTRSYIENIITAHLNILKWARVCLAKRGF